MSGDLLVAEDAQDDSNSEYLFDRRYCLVRQLARVSAGGRVFAAKHAVTHKPCAIKLLDRDAKESVRKRMRREMEALALVQGPGVVDFLDGGESGGRLFIVLELLAGRTLDGVLAARTKLASGQTARVGAAIADVLARCHSRGVVHRDVKPANVFVSGRDTICVLDFGVAKLTNPAKHIEALTQENSLLGTPEYMAPEALVASPDVDHRADQYSLGVLLYECLAGTVPFEGAYGEVLMKITKSKDDVARGLPSKTSPLLAAVIVRALDRAPERRFANMDEMAAALHAAESEASAPPLFDLSYVARSRLAPTLADAPIPKSMAESARRQFERVPYVTMARARLREGEDVEGRVEEISEGGLQFLGPRSIPEGASIVIRFALPVSGRMIEIHAVSRWTRPTRVLHVTGFAFTKLPADAAAEIARYVALLGKL